VLHEWCDKGVIPIPHRTGRPIVHRIAKCTPYHVSHLFGFWIAHDVDATWLEAPAEDGSHYALMVGGSTGTPSNTASLFVARNARPSSGARLCRPPVRATAHSLRARCAASHRNVLHHSWSAP
jgi:hypothetical protein